MKLTTRRKVVASIAALSLITAACGGGDDDSTATDAPAEETTGESMAEDTEAPEESMAEDTEAPEESMAEDTAAEGTAAEGGDVAESDYDWSDVRRRQAVSKAIDRQAIVDNIFLGSRAVGDDFWPSTFVGYRGGDSCGNLQYDPEGAKALWDEAGGNAGPITLWFNSGAGHEEWVEAVANQLKENLGVEDVQFQSLEFADYLDKLDNGEVNGPYRLGWLMDYPSPGNFLGPIHGTMGSSNTTGFSNEDFDAAVAAGDSKELADSVGDYQAAGDILCDQLPISPMFFGKLQVVWGNNVSNVQFDQFQRLKVTEVEETDGDGNVNVYVCEPQNGLFGQMTGETCGAEVVNGLFTGLYSLGDDGNIVYDGVAESIETSDDGTNWTIKLKDGWTFHDGTPVNAESFVGAWNWASLGANGAQNQYFFSILGIKGFDAMNPPEPEEGSDDTTVPADQVPTELEGLSATDDLTIEVSLDKAFPQLPLVMLYDAFNPLPEAFYADPEGFGEAPIGNGPFMMDGSWEHDVQVKTVAYDGYAGNAPKVGGITYKIYSDDATGYNDVRSDALDVMDQIPTAELAGAQAEFGDRYLEAATSSFNYLGFPIDLELAASWHAG